MAVAIEDAGFDIRDQIMWVYGSGFPKSHDISKAIDKGQGENKARQLRFTEWMRSTGITARQIDDITGTKMGSHYTTHPTQPAIATADLFDKLRPYLPEVPEEIERLVAERTGIEWIAYKNREVIGTQKFIRNTQSWEAKAGMLSIGEKNINISAPATEQAKQWEGWGTALKPAHEPMVLARKPISESTIAENVLKWGTGAINIDACRVAKDEKLNGGGTIDKSNYNTVTLPSVPIRTRSGIETGGRFPANFIHDGSDEVLEQLPQANGESVARFFYVAKASNRDRNSAWNGQEIGLDEKKKYDRKSDGKSTFENGNSYKKNFHPTVKPTELMKYLCRLVTPPNGIVLDIFAGSGSTLVACKQEGYQYIGIEMQPEYIEIIKARLTYEEQEPEEEQTQQPAQPTIFDWI
jgi:DNA modification methylase